MCWWDALLLWADLLTAWCVSTCCVDGLICWCLMSMSWLLIAWCVSAWCLDELFCWSRCLYVGTWCVDGLVCGYVVFGSWFALDVFDNVMCWWADFLIAWCVNSCTTVPLVVRVLILQTNSATFIGGLLWLNECLCVSDQSFASNGWRSFRNQHFYSESRSGGNFDYESSSGENHIWCAYRGELNFSHLQFSVIDFALF